MFSLLFFDWTHIPKTQVISETVWNKHGAWKKKTELGTKKNGARDQKKTPKGGYQSKRKENLSLVIDNYGQLINIKVC